MASPSSLPERCSSSRAPRAEPPESLEDGGQRFDDPDARRQAGIAGGRRPGQMVVHRRIDTAEFIAQTIPPWFLDPLGQGGQHADRRLEGMRQVAGGMAGMLHQPPVPRQYPVHGHGKPGELAGQAGVEPLDLAVLHPAQVGLHPPQRGEPPVHLQRQGGEHQQPQDDQR